MKLVVVGSSNMDLVISLPRIPAVGETVLGGKSSMVFGGKGANQAVASIRSGGDIAYIAKVGNDLFGQNMKNHFKKEGFRTDFILTDEKIEVNNFKTYEVNYSDHYPIMARLNF